MNIKFIIPGKPMGKQRPRVMKSGITFTPKETVNYESLVKLTYSQLPETNIFKDEVKIRITAYYEIPKSISDKKKRHMSAGLIRPAKKPDCDNIAKIICDALNGIAYKDDSQIVSCIVDKYYSDIPRVEVEIWE